MLQGIANLQWLYSKYGQVFFSIKFGWGVEGPTLYYNISRSHKTFFRKVLSVIARCVVTHLRPGRRYTLMKESGRVSPSSSTVWRPRARSTVTYRMPAWES